MICGSGGRKVGSLKRRVRSQLARWVMKNCTPLWREAHFQVKMYKTHQFRTLLEVEMSKKCTLLWREAHFQVKMYKTPHVRATFGGSDVEKVHAGCGAKHISKSKCTKHHMFAPLLEARMLKKCTPLWREAHFQVKMLKTPGVRTTFGGSDAASLQYTTLQDITLHYTPQHYNYNYTTTLHYTPLHSTTLNCTTLHYTKLHYTTLHYTTLHFHYTTLHYTTFHYTSLHYITLHYTPLHYNYNYTPLH